MWPWPRWLLVTKSAGPSAAQAPAAAPPAPVQYDWSDEESEQILEFHSDSFRGVWGN